MFRGNKKIAVTGSRGRLGSYLVGCGCEPLECDVTSSKEVKSALQDVDPDVIIHCAAITAVDKCEMESFNRATIVNGTSLNILRNNFGGRLIYLSTDYIFDGKNGPYSEYSPPNPINHYGASKLFGEDIIKEFNFHYDTIVRTTILYGGGGKKFDFVSLVVNYLASNMPVELPANLKGNPTYIPHLANALFHIVEMKDPPKVVNIAGLDIVSRYELGIMIANIFGFDVNLVKYTRRVPGIARRPLKAGLKLDLAKKLKIPIYSVCDGLREMRKEYRNGKERIASSRV